MTRCVILILVVAVSFLSPLACGADLAVRGQNATYVAQLRGTSEVPPTATTATGIATLTRSGSSVTYTVTASGFTTTLNVGHINIGAAGAIGSVIVPFTISAQSGIVATGSIDLAEPTR